MLYLREGTCDGDQVACEQHTGGSCGAGGDDEVVTHEGEPGLYFLFLDSGNWGTQYSLDITDL